MNICVTDQLIFDFTNENVSFKENKE